MLTARLSMGGDPVEGRVGKRLEVANTGTDLARYEALLKELDVIRMCGALLLVRRFVLATAISLLAATAVVWTGLWYFFPLQLSGRAD